MLQLPPLLKDVMDAMHEHYKDMLEEEVCILKNLLTRIRLYYVKDFDPNDDVKIGDMITVLRGLQDVYDTILESSEYLQKK